MLLGHKGEFLTIAHMGVLKLRAPIGQNDGAPIIRTPKKWTPNLQKQP